MASSRINIDEPRYDQSTFIGRAKHFFITTNPLNLFTTPQQLEEAKNIVEKHRFCITFFFLTLPLLIVTKYRLLADTLFICLLPLQAVWNQISTD